MLKSLLLLLVLISPLSAQITVTGEGRVSAVPDMAVLTLGVVEESGSAEVANTKLKNSLNGLMAKLKELNFEDKDLCTMNYNLTPKYSNQPNVDPTIVGYSASSQISVKVRDLNKLDGTIEGLVKKGANVIKGVSFEVTNTEKLMDEARNLAALDAKRKAKLYAASLGVNIGLVKSVVENERYAPTYDTMRSNAPMESKRIQPGERTLTVNSTFVFNILSNIKE